MSNEFVMVPRELLDRIERAGCWPADAKDLREILARPAEQHHGEPVAVASIYIETLDGQLVATVRRFDASRLPKGCLVDLYKYPADLCEVERKLEDQRREFVHAQTVEHRKWAELVESLKGQLAKQDSLLREASGKLIMLAARIIDEPLRSLRSDLDNDGPITRIKVTDGVDQAGNSLGGLAVGIRRVADALSASAEPSAPKCNRCENTGKHTVLGKCPKCGSW